MVSRTKRGEKTTADILAAARAHLAESGLEAFSLREVARRVELSPSALYNHFDSRDALINELAMECVQLLGVYFGGVPQASGAAQRLRGLADAYLRFAEEEPTRYRLVFDMLESPVASWDQYAQVAYPFTAIVEAVAAGIESGEFEDREGVGAARIAYGLWALVHGFVMLSLHHLVGITDDLTSMQRAAIDVHIAGLAPSAGISVKGSTR